MSSYFPFNLAVYFRDVHMFCHFSVTMIQCFLKRVLYALSKRSSSLPICNLCLSVSTVSQWWHSSWLLETAVVQDHVFCTRAKRDRDAFLKRYVDFAKRNHSLSISVLVNFQMWMDITTFLINIYWYLIIYHTAIGWMLILFGLCSFQNKTSTLYFLSLCCPLYI